MFKLFPLTAESSPRENILPGAAFHLSRAVTGHGNNPTAAWRDVSADSALPVDVATGSAEAGLLVSARSDRR